MNSKERHNKALDNFLAEIDNAGLVMQDWECIEQVAEFKRHFVIICNDDVEEYMIGVFNRETATSAGYFEPQPRACGDIHECRYHFALVCAELAKQEV